jgi:hypothetical protein
MDYQAMMFVIKSEGRHSDGVPKTNRVLRRPVAVGEKIKLSNATA